jgi:hypothetical protein
MSKKQKEQTPAATPAPETPTVVTAPTVATPAPEAPKPKVEKVPDPRTFTLADPAFTAGKGFATALLEELKKGPGTATQLSDRLLASGEYARVAPQAAKLRPVRVVETQLKNWLAAGKVSAV